MVPAQLRHQVSMEETFLLRHQHEHRDFAAEYFPQKKQVREFSLDKDNSPEEYEYFESARSTYNTCKSQVEKIRSRITNLREQLQSSEKELNAPKKKMASSDEMEAGDLESNDNDEDEVSSIGRNDGSINFPNDQLPPVELIF